MRKIFVFFALAILFFNSVHATLLVTQQPNALYNYGDIVQIPIVLKATTNVYGIVEMSVICNGKETNFYKNGIKLAAGEENKIDAGVILDKQNVGNSSAFCLIKAISGQEYVLTEKFRVSDKINIEMLTNQTEFKPQESVSVEGKATKENGQFADGFVDVTFIPENATENINYKGTINNGFFSVAFTLPENLKAGNYALKIKAYEKDSFNDITNQGSHDFGIRVVQIPTSLELIAESSGINPGDSFKVKAILHDQTGNQIDSTAFISVKDSAGKLRDQGERKTDEFLEVPTKYSEPPAMWSVIATSETMTGEISFKINEKESADIKIVNGTLVMTNTGNVPYNESVLVKIGSETENLGVFLGIDEIKKYSLTAPDGEYKIEVINEGKTQASERAMLTGKVVGVKEASAETFSLTKYPIAWLFVILVLGFMAILILRRNLFARSFSNYSSVPKREKITPRRETSAMKRSGFALKSKNKAELSLSLRGEKQATDVALIRIRNPSEMKNEESAKALQEIIDFAEDNKAVPCISEGYGNIMFILAPVMSKTFKNEKTIIEIGKKAGEILGRYNKLAKEKIDFGISVNSGDMIIRKDGNMMKFMGLGNFVNTSKKVASLSNGEVLLSEDMKNKVISEMNVEKQQRTDANVYTVREPKFKGDASGFIEKFKERMDKGN
ncbi:hypothetical protein HY449_03455 [Candidatus Pacearchaeota archaeon]|nr:hypothetical protein [Candidatus Pacearchaeota archaeon]